MRFALLLVAAFLAVDPTGWDSYGPFRFALISTIGFASIATSFGAGDVRSQPLPRWSVLGWTVVLGAMSISTILSTDLWHATIGTPDRHFGLATWFLLAGLFAVSSLYPQSIGRPVQLAASVVAATSGLWALLENFDIGWFTSSFADDRIGGPMGQPAFLGAGMLLVIPLSAAVVFDGTYRLATRLVAGIATGLGVLALGLSQSRAAWVGAAIVLAIVLIRRRHLLIGVASAVVIAVVLIFTPVGDRAATLTDTSTGVVPGRIDEWSVGVRALTDTPTFGLTGHGPEGYRTVFGRHVDEEYVIQHGRDVITDRAHNGLLDTALQGGIIAGAGMALLMSGLAITAVQRMRSDNPLDVALAAAVLGYLVQQLALFPLAELDPVLWVLAGLLVARRPHRQNYPPPLFRQVSGTKRAAMFAAGSMAAISAVAGMSDVAADHAVGDAITALDAGEPGQALEFADSARRRRPDSIRYDFIAARTATRSSDPDRFSTALQLLNAGLDTSPTDPALLSERGAVLLEVARRSPDGRFLDAALLTLADLEATDPNNPANEQVYGIALALDEQTDEAIAQLTHASELDPTGVEPLLNLAVVQLEAGRLEAGRVTLDAIDVLAPANARVQNLRREFLSE